MGWKDIPVFITGSTGLVGSYLTNKFLEKEAFVVSLIRDDLKTAVNINPDVIVTGDVRDQKLIERVINEYSIQYVFHLAAQTQVTLANRSPAETLDVNINGTIAILEAVRKSPWVKRTFIASSDKAYGEGDRRIEGSPLHGDSPYDVSKSCVDLLAQSYISTYKLPIAIYRSGNIFGGGDLNWNRLIPSTIRSFIRNEPVLIRSNGKMIRDYFYVEDTVGAYLKLAEYSAQGPYNFSNDNPRSVIDVVLTISKIMGISNPDILILDTASNEINSQSLYALKAKKELLWYPQYSFEEGIKKTIEWYKEYLK